LGLGERMQAPQRITLQEVNSMKVGLVGYGKAGQAVARVLQDAPGFELAWVVRKSPSAAGQTVPETSIPLVGLTASDWASWLDAHPVDALVDFSQAQTLHTYGEALRQHPIMLVSAISAYSPADLDYARDLGRDIRVMCSANITLGINFLILAAKLLRRIAPFADVEILEQHFRGKAEVSGTARKIAQSLQVEDDRITSLRLGGIIGHHEVIFGFPHQTVRLIHNSIERRAFGTGAVFALKQLAECQNGFYTFDDLMMRLVKQELMAATPT